MCVFTSAVRSTFFIKNGMDMGRYDGSVSSSVSAKINSHLMYLFVRYLQILRKRLYDMVSQVALKACTMMQADQLEIAFPVLRMAEVSGNKMAMKTSLFGVILYGADNRRFPLASCAC